MNLHTTNAAKKKHMKMGVVRVTTTKKPPYRSKIKITSPFLNDIGFIQGTPIIATLRPDGFTLNLRDINGADKMCGNSKLIHVGLDGKKTTLTLNFSNNFSTPELSTDDFLAIRYEYGVITAKKLPPAQKYYVVAAQNYGAFLRLNGAWLTEAGFMPDAIVTVARQPGNITLRTWEDMTSTYDEIVKFARAHQYQVMQVQRNQEITFFDLDGYLLNRAGFETNSIAGINYEYGTISLFKPDLQKLGL